MRRKSKLLAGIAALVLASPVWAQFGTKQTQFRNSVQSLTGTLDVHGVASGTVAGPAATTQYTSDQHVSGILKLDHYNALTGALTGTLTGSITVTEQAVISSACTITNTLTASSSAQSDFLGQPLVFNLSFDIGSDTWSLWPSNNSINGTNTSVQNCAGQSQTSSATNPMRFMPINMKMGFPFPASGFDLTGSGQVTCDGCGNAASNAVLYTFTYNLKATVNPCTYTLSNSSYAFTASASTGSVTVTTAAGCSWSATIPPDPWVTITSGTSFSGTGTVTYSVSANPASNTSPNTARSTAFTVAGQTITITQSAQGLRFVPMTPCRVMETRSLYNFEGRTGAFGPPTLNAAETRTLNLPSSNVCSVPSSARAYVVNVTVIPNGGGVGFATVWPAGETRPNVWTIRSPDGQIVANSSIVKAGANGGISVFSSDKTDLLIDISGYYADNSNTAGLAYYPLTPCRVIDTRILYRSTTGPFGPPSMNAGETRKFRFPATPYCTVPLAAAYSVTITAVPPGPLAYLTAWPDGGAQPNVSSINSFIGRVLANSVIVPAASDGSIDVFAYNATDFLVDINGYFAPDDGRTGLFFFPVTQCRVSDSTVSGGAFADDTARTIAIPAASNCTGIPASAQGYALNVTALPAGNPMPFLTAYPTGQPRPNASILNAFQGQVVTNGAIIPAGTNGSVDIYAYRGTDVVVEISGFFGR